MFLSRLCHLDDKGDLAFDDSGQRRRTAQMATTATIKREKRKMFSWTVLAAVTALCKKCENDVPG